MSHYSVMYLLQICCLIKKWKISKILVIWTISDLLIVSFFINNFSYSSSFSDLQPIILVLVTVTKISVSGSLINEYKKT